ncbi:structural maintenance of chromosomes protein 6 [Prorops nasuta]|uniref:structural maintenance of chromosomes protein 6 n=1 Tax=Prorops nasuta TaxID=863751 RepID=UPI0034D0157A
MSQCQRLKRKKKFPFPDESQQTKRFKDHESFLEEEAISFDDTSDILPGKVIRIFIRNFMCHGGLDIKLNKNVNFVVGSNGSGKSAILAALTIGLGARANVTNRSTSLQGFVQKGRSYATIEITLSNDGPLAYKPELYGHEITVLRRIGSSPGYKLKSYNGQIISTKREELNRIIRALNIQIENPISVMNQDVSRSFLVSSKPSERYQLFMKATRLDVIGNNYETALFTSLETREKLKEVNMKLSKIKEEIDHLKKCIKKSEEVTKLRSNLIDIENELIWVAAIVEENKLTKTKDDLQFHQDNLKNLEEATVNAKTDKIDAEIEKLNKQIEEEEAAANDSIENYNKAKSVFIASKESQTRKLREIKSMESQIKRSEIDIRCLHKEIQRLEGDAATTNKKEEIQNHISECENKLDEVEAMLRTKQTDEMHFESNKVRLSQELKSKKIEMERYEGQIKKIQRDLQAFKQQANDSFAVFGQNIPRLLKRINEEANRGRFKVKPVGPLGAYITLKDSAWAPAVEHFLKRSFLTTFCVDNSSDAKILNAIMKEIYLNENTPQIISSKFYNHVHDVCNEGIQSQTHQSLLNAMNISHPVIANCLIDQNEIECILLIPTSKEACEIMSDAARVPIHSKKAITLNGDIFYPDPDYRSYGGRPDLRAKILQVSASEAKQVLEEELSTAMAEYKISKDYFTDLVDKQKRTNTELTNISSLVNKLRISQQELKAKIADLKDKIQLLDTTHITILKSELTELETKLQQLKTDQQTLNEEEKSLTEKYTECEKTLKKLKESKSNIGSRVDPLKKKIKYLNDDKKMLKVRAQCNQRKIEETRILIQTAVAAYETQQRVTDKAVKDALTKCARIDTERTKNELKNEKEVIESKIRDIENRIGSVEDLTAKLFDKEKNHGYTIDFAAAIERCNNKLINLLEYRKIMFEEMKNAIGIRVQNAFVSILAIRNYQGFIEIDHTNKVLDLEVHPKTGSQKADTKALSGGERSYSTVAFILALWDCTRLPFYFLDEFDVFMDKVNRRVIMDILLDHAKCHPQSQFTFLTPLDTSTVLRHDYVTVHSLAAPERDGHNDD